MSRRAVVLITLALVAACSSEEQLNPQPLPPADRGGGTTSPNQPPGAVTGDESFGGNCNSAKLPVEGEACDAAKDTTCSWAVTCKSGLVLPFELTCTNGKWEVTNGCPEEGKTDARGCPASQPENGASCTLAPNNSQCGYVLECTSYRKTALAQCTNDGSGSGSTWRTTPLGTCD